jgi:thiosulfate/3-mercaptopyruvate sulfurtransferase
MTGPLVSTAWLREHLGDPGLRVVDCRFKLGEPGATEPLWREAPIPGAAFLDVDRDLASPPGERGRHPLPAADAFEAAVRRAGVGPDTLVVAYDEAAEGGAARLWWLLRHFGHDRAAVLDGGLRAWREEGGELRAAEDEAEDAGAGAHDGGEAAAFAARPRDDDVVELAEEVAAAALGACGGVPTPVPSRASGSARVLLDARAPERYRGETEPIDPVAGHIPGAANVPFAELAPDGRFLPPDQLRERLEAAGVASGTEAVAYCGSGVTAAIVVLAAEAAGLPPVRLYPGSWSEWSGRGLPVARH